MNTLMRSPDAQSFDGRLYTSFIVKRLAEIKIQDFENKMNFVTFSDQFANLLRVYRDSDYNVFVAKEIFDRYGMFVVERGHLGGYRHIKAFFRQDEINSYGISDSDLENCFRLMSTTEFQKIDMFSYAPGSWAACTDTVRSFILDATYDTLLVPLGNDGEMIYGDHDDTLKGGHISVGDLWQQFLVDPDDSILLTSREHYPDGDEGIKLRPITDFLVSSKISPLEVKRHLITETQFDEIKNRLEEHMIESLSATYENLQQCQFQSTGCLLSFLSKDKESCSYCYEVSSFPSSNVSRVLLFIIEYFFSKRAQ